VHAQPCLFTDAHLPTSISRLSSQLYTSATANINEPDSVLLTPCPSGGLQDISRRLVIVTKAVKALNDLDGAPAHYREVKSFLTNLKMTLEALKVESVVLHPKYVDEVKVQVQKIRVPIEESLTVTRGYEASLGIAAKKGRFRNVQKKLDWRFVVSKKADALRRTIEGDMMILNSIQTRLIL
tara:strand:- start:805 stop:1350 length:546 start_codon:yes stop_codon:yes gene_type:complete